MKNKFCLVTIITYALVGCLGCKQYANPKQNISSFATKLSCNPVPAVEDYTHCNPIFAGY